MGENLAVNGARARLAWLALASACGDAGAVSVEDAAAGSQRDAEGWSDPSSPGRGDASAANYAFPCLGEHEPTHEPTFEAVYLDVFCRAGCVQPYCHGTRGAWADLDLSTIPGAYAALVGARAGQKLPVDGRPTCHESPLLRVEPGAPDRSLLYLKVSGAPPCGSAMPPSDSGWEPIAAEQLEQIRRWILAGAPLAP
jgi:hypothetical protein